MSASWKAQALFASFWSTADYVLFRLVSVLVTNVLVARVLSPAGYGAFGLAITAAQTAWMLADLGISQYGIRTAAQAEGAAERRRMLHELQSLRVVLGAAVFAAACLALEALPLDPRWVGAVRLSCLYVAVLSLYPLWYFKALGWFRQIFFANTFSLALYVAGAFALIRGSGDLAAACLLWALSLLPGALIMLLLLSRKEGGGFLVPKPAVLRASLAHFAEAKDFFLMALFNNLYISAPVYVATALVDEQGLGHFNAAYRLYLYMASALLPVSHVFYPLLSRSCAAAAAPGAGAVKERQRLFQRVAFDLILPVVLVAALFRREITLLLYGENYAPSAALLGYLAAPILLSTMRLTLANLMVAGGRQRDLVFAALGQALLAAAASFLLVRRAGPAGAAAAVLIGEAFYLLAIAALLVRRRLLGLADMIAGLSWQAVVALAAMFGVMTALDAHWIAAAAAGAAAYALVLLALGELRVLAREGSR